MLTIEMVWTLIILGYIGVILAFYGNIQQMWLDFQGYRYDKKEERNQKKESL